MPIFSPVPFWGPKFLSRFLEWLSQMILFPTQVIFGASIDSKRLKKCKKYQKWGLKKHQIFVFFSFRLNFSQNTQGFIPKVAMVIHQAKSF